MKQRNEYDNRAPDGEPPPRRRSALSRPLVPNDDVHGIRKPRSLVRENLLFFAVFIPLGLLGGGVVYLIAWLAGANR